MIKLYKDLTDAQALKGLNKDNQPVVQGGLMFTREGHIYIQNGEVGTTNNINIYGKDDPDVADFIANVDFGNLASGTDLSGKTAMEILNEMLNIEYAPVVINNYNVIFSSSIPLYIQRYNNDFNLSNSSLYDYINSLDYEVKTQNGIIRPISSTLNVAIAQTNNYGNIIQTVTTNEIGTIRISATAEFLESSNTVKTNKNNNTNKTSTRENTPLREASIDNNIDPITYRLKPKTLSKTKLIYVIDPLVINYNGDKECKIFTQLLSGDNIEFTATITSDNPVYISIPPNKSLSSIKFEMFDSVLNKWIDITSKLSINNNNFDYYNKQDNYFVKYAYTEITGEAKYKVTIKS